MGSANSNAEALERRRIEREMRLGLHGQLSTGMSNHRMSLQPVSPGPHPEWLAPEWNYERESAQRRAAPFLSEQPQWTGATWARPQQLTSPPPPRPRGVETAGAVVTQPHSILLESSRLTAGATSPKRAPKTQQKSPSPTRLRWVGASPKREAHHPSLDLLAPAQRTLRYLQSRGKSEPRSKLPKSATRQRSRSPRFSPGPEPRAKTSALKPTMKQALYLVSLEELEERTSLLNEEVDTFDTILALFSYAVEMELIRVAAFEMFDLESKVRRAITSQEKRERHILAYWIAENYEDAKLSEGIRRVQSRPSPQRTPSRSPWRLPLGLSEDRRRSIPGQKSTERDSFLVHAHMSPSPIPPDRHTQKKVGQESRFGVPSRFFDDVRKDEGAWENHTRFARREEPYPCAADATSAKPTPATNLGRGSPQPKAFRSAAHICLDECKETTEPLKGETKGWRTAANGPFAVRTREFGSDGDRAFAASASASGLPEPAGEAMKEPHVTEESQTTHLQTRTDAPLGNPHCQSSNAPRSMSTSARRGVHGQNRTTEPIQTESESNRHPSHWDVNRGPVPAARVEETLRAAGTQSSQLHATHLRTAPIPATNVDADRARTPELRDTTKKGLCGTAQDDSRSKHVSREPFEKVLSRPREAPANTGPAIVVPHHLYQEKREPQSPAQFLDALSPIQANTLDDNTSSDCTVYMDPFPEKAPKHRQPSLPSASWANELEQRQGELHRKILAQRASMSGSPLPLRTAPVPPVSPSEGEPHDDFVDFEDARLTSAATVNNRFAALLNASL